MLFPFQVCQILTVVSVQELIEGFVAFAEVLLIVPVPKEEFVDLMTCYVFRFYFVIYLLLLLNQNLPE